MKEATEELTACIRMAVKAVSGVLDCRFRDLKFQVPA
jgi:hypothetical protein